VDDKTSASGAGRPDALDSALDAGDDAAAGAVAENANAENANQVADAASRRSARNPPTPAELRAAAGISTDLRAAIRAAARNTTGDGQDAGASSDRGSRAPSAVSVAQASQFAALAADARAAAGPISPELLTGPYLQNAVRVSSLEAAAATALDRDGASVSSQIVESIRLQWAKGGGDAQMTLQPGYLGGLSVSLRVDKDVVTASVLAESPAVREWLRANESSLRQGLVDVGLRLEKFQVSDVSAQTPARDADARDRPSGRDRQSAPRQPRPDRSDSTFEVIAE
jgi:flagellar hook-length control protein FliK